MISWILCIVMLMTYPKTGNDILLLSAGLFAIAGNIFMSSSSTKDIKIKHEE